MGSFIFIHVIRIWVVRWNHLGFQFIGTHPPSVTFWSQNFWLQQMNRWLIVISRIISFHNIRFWVCFAIQWREEYYRSVFLVVIKFQLLKINSWFLCLFKILIINCVHVTFRSESSNFSLVYLIEKLNMFHWKCLLCISRPEHCNFIHSPLLMMMKIP